MARYSADFGRDQDGWESRPWRGARYDEWGGGYRGSQGYGGFGGARYDAGYAGMEGREGFGTSFRSTERGGFGGREAGPGAYDAGFTGRGGWRGGFGTEVMDPRGATWNDRGNDRGGQWRGERGAGRGQVRAADLMTENPEFVTPDTPIMDVARRMRDLDVGIIPVVDSQEGRRLRGVITDRDIAIRAVAEGKDGQATVSDVMTSRVETCNKNDSVDDVMELMQREQVRRVPITDREGRLVGIIAQADLAVDYSGYDREREARVEHTLERISEPARPERGWGM